jgi:hypothetical protein
VQLAKAIAPPSHSKLGELGEGDEVAGGVFYADFSGAVESGAFGEIDFGAVDGGFYGFEILNFDLGEGGAFADGGGDRGEIVAGTGAGLVHDLGGAASECDEGEFIAFGDFGGFAEAELFGARKGGRVRFLLQRARG